MSTLDVMYCFQELNKVVRSPAGQQALTDLQKHFDQLSFGIANLLVALDAQPNDMVKREDGKHICYSSECLKHQPAGATVEDNGHAENCPQRLREEAIATIVMRSVAEAQEMRRKAALFDLMVEYAGKTFDYWDNDKDSKVGKRLLFMAGESPDYEGKAHPLGVYFAEQRVKAQAGKKGTTDA